MGLYLFQDLNRETEKRHSQMKDWGDGTLHSVNSSSMLLKDDCHVLSGMADVNMSSSPERGAAW